MTTGLSLDELCHSIPTREAGFWLRELEWFGFEEDPDHPGRLTTRFIDPLIVECNQRVGGFDGLEVLELGPFEGAHSINLATFSPARVISIEANPYNFIKCLIVKQYYGLANTSFLLCNFVEYLQQCDRRFDFILAAGVLYHLREPFKALELVMQRTDAIGICTTVYAEDDSPFNMTGATREIEKNGHQFKLYERMNTLTTKGKKHGIDETAWMMTEPELLKYLDVSGWEYEKFPYKRLSSGGLRTRLFAKRKPISG